MGSTQTEVVLLRPLSRLLNDRGTPLGVLSLPFLAKSPQGTTPLRGPESFTVTQGGETVMGRYDKIPERNLGCGAITVPSCPTGADAKQDIVARPKILAVTIFECRSG